MTEVECLFPSVKVFVELTTHPCFSLSYCYCNLILLHFHPTLHPFINLLANKFIIILGIIYFVCKFFLTNKKMIRSIIILFFVFYLNLTIDASVSPLDYYNNENEYFIKNKEPLISEINIQMPGVMPKKVEVVFPAYLKKKNYSLALNCNF